MTGDSGVTFRAAGVGDIDTLIALRIEFLNEAFHRTSGRDTEELTQNLRSYFERTLPAGDFIAWLAEYEGAVVATSGMSVWSSPPKYGGAVEGRKGYIMNMYTVPSMRRKGVATQLLKKLLKDAGTRGIKYIHLHATPMGLGVYTKAGFTEPVFEELGLKLE